MSSMSSWHTTASGHNLLIQPAYRFDIQQVNRKFNARHMCASRTYEYYVPAFMLGLACDGSEADKAIIDTFREALGAYMGSHPFHNFTKRQNYTSHAIAKKRKPAPDRSYRGPLQAKPEAGDAPAAGAAAAAPTGDGEAATAALPPAAANDPAPAVGTATALTPAADAAQSGQAEQAAAANSGEAAGAAEQAGPSQPAGRGGGGRGAKRPREVVLDEDDEGAGEEDLDDEDLGGEADGEGAVGAPSSNGAGKGETYSAADFQADLRFLQEKDPRDPVTQQHYRWGGSWRAQALMCRY